MFLEIKLEAWLTIVAIILGPLLAFAVQRWRDSRQERRNRKLHIFRTLMSTRGAQMTPSHIDALNGIEVEFYAKKGADKKVVDAWRLLVDHVYIPDDLQADALRAWAEKKKDLTIDLLYEMAQSLGYEFDKVTIRKNVYYPRAYADADEEWHQMRKAWLEVLNGLRPLTMTMLGPVHVQPPLPSAEEIVTEQTPPALPPAHHKH